MKDKCIVKVKDYKPKEVCRVHKGTRLVINDHGTSGQVQKIEQGCFENELLIEILLENKRTIRVIYDQENPDVFLKRFPTVEN